MTSSSLSDLLFLAIFNVILSNSCLGKSASPDQAESANELPDDASGKESEEYYTDGDG
jgi:hypothetical protein